MAHIDRTREFLALVEVTAAGRGGGSHAFPAPLHVPQHSGHAVPDSRSAFMSAVSSVSTDLHGASLKLAALTKRAYYLHPCVLACAVLRVASIIVFRRW